MVLMEENIRPNFSQEQAKAVLLSHYQIDVDTIKELTAELDRNYYVLDKDGAQFILKVAHSSVSDAVLDLQNTTLQHLSHTLDIFPQLMPTIQKQASVRIAGSDGHDYNVRLLKYLPGLPLVDFRPHTPELLYDIGYHLGRLSNAMQAFDHPEKRLDYRWNILNFPDIQSYSADMPDEKQSLIQYFSDLYQQDVVPYIGQARHSFIYNDANDHNILVQQDGFERAFVSGMIDFGDMVYSLTVADLAVALAYIMMHKDQPIDTATHVLRGYFSTNTLTEIEIKMLYPLIASRLCMSVCISWYQQLREPDNPHLSISEDGAWQLLTRLREIHPDLAHYKFRNACGLPPYPDSTPLLDWLRHQTFDPILGTPITSENSVVLDLSIGSVELGLVDDFADTEAFTHRIFNEIARGKFAIGKYAEARPIYLGEKYAVSHHERRTIHIGVDIFAPAETAIYAPLEGVVHRLHDNGTDKDYGPTLILRHQPRPDFQFYTIYGHLHEDVLDDLQVGQLIKQGQNLAKIGDFPRNGDWPPHVHFQIILDMLNYDGDYPGVASPTDQAVWEALSPNPNLILNLPFDVRAKQASDHQTIINARKTNLNPSMSISYQDPLKIERGYKHYLYDENGQAYLDCVNNVPHVGHSHPRVVRAAQRQMAVLNTNTRYLHDTIIEYVGRLCATLPDPLSVCFFVNSGSEANELAIRLAQAYTDGSDFIVIDHAYHGHTSSLIELSPYKFNGRGGKGKPDHVEIATMPDGYRGAIRGYDQAVGEHYARSVRDALSRIQGRGKQVAAFWAEGILGCGGQMTLSQNYLNTAYDAVRSAGGVCIADEVQVGFGRVGEHFWAFQLQGVIPDIVTMGKPIGNGHPLAAVVTTREIADKFNNGMEYFNTFGGNPVSCAIGLEVLNIIEEEHLQQNALDVGNYWLTCFRERQSQYPIIGDVRGAGLFIGVELIRDSETLEPADVEAPYIVERMKKAGFLISTEGPLHNVLKMKPPIIFQKKHVDQFMSAFDDILSETALSSIGR